MPTVAVGRAERHALVRAPMKSSVAALFSLGRFVHECDFDRVVAAAEVPKLLGCGKSKRIRVFVRARDARDDAAHSSEFVVVANIAARATCARCQNSKHGGDIVEVDPLSTALIGTGSLRRRRWR